LKKERFIKKGWNDISREDKWNLADEIIKVAFIIYNSGIIVAEKLEMPDEILSNIRQRSPRASGHANSETFLNRNLEEMLAPEREALPEAIRKVAEIIGNDPRVVAKKLEVPEKYILKQ